MQLTSRLSWTLALALLVATTPMRNAFAQGVGESSPLEVGSADNLLDASQPSPGLRAGDFRLYPAAGAATAYDSNVFATPGMREEQALAVAQAQMHVENEPGGPALSGDTFARARRFSDTADQDTTEYGASVSLATQPELQNAFAGQLLAQRRFESRTEIETPNTRDVSFYDEWRGNVSYVRSFNRLALRTSLAGRNVSYQESSQRYRDRSTYRGEVGAALDLHTGVALVGTGYYGGDDFRFSSPLVTSAHTVGALAGIRVGVPEILDLQFTAGQFRRTYDDHRGEIRGLTVRGSMLWKPTRLTTLNADLLREDAPTRVIGSFGKIRTSGSLGIQHAYRRDIQLFARSRLVVDKFDGSSRTDRTVSVETGAAWAVTSRVAVAAEYDYAARNSGLVDESFNRHVVSVSLQWRL